MSISQLWARICALFTFSQPKGVSEMDTADANAAATTDLVATTAADTVTTADSGAAATAAPAILVVDDGAPAATAVAALVAVAPGLVATAAPVTADASAPAALDADDEAETGDELESLKAITGDGVDLFVTVLKDLVSFAIDMGHDFESAFDKSVARAKALAAKL